MGSLGSCRFPDTAPPTLLCSGHKPQQKQGHAPSTTSYSETVLVLLIPTVKVKGPKRLVAPGHRSTISRAHLGQPAHLGTRCRLHWLAMVLQGLEVLPRTESSAHTLLWKLKLRASLTWWQPGGNCGMGKPRRLWSTACSRTAAGPSLSLPRGQAATVASLHPAWPMR